MQGVVVLMAMRSYNVPDNAGCHVHVGSPLLALTHKVRAFLLGELGKATLVAARAPVIVRPLDSVLLAPVHLRPPVFAFHFHPLEKYF